MPLRKFIEVTNGTITGSCEAFMDAEATPAAGLIEVSAETDLFAVMGCPFDAETQTIGAKPAAPKFVSRYEFASLFTMAEDMDIDDAAVTDREVRFFLRRTQMSDDAFPLTHPDVQRGLAMLVAKGLLTAERASQVLTGTPPPAE